MAIQFLPMVRPEVAGPLDFTPVNRLIGDARQSMDQQHEIGQNRLIGEAASKQGNRAAAKLASEQGRLKESAWFSDRADRDEDRKAALRDKAKQKIAGLAQNILEAPEEHRAAMWSKIRALDPDGDNELRSAGIDPNDWQAGANMIIAEARGFQDPLDRELKQAQIDKLRREKQSPADEYSARAAALAQYGIDPNSPEGRQFILNGKLPDAEGGVKPPSGYIRDPNDPSRLTYVPGGPADPAVTPTEGAANSANFASRMIDAEENVRKVMGGSPDRPAYDPTSSGKAVSNAWRGVVGDDVANLTASEGTQRYRQAAMQWIRAFLRKESGAAISPSEFEDDFQTYFPQPGDGPELVKQKEAARLGATQGFIANTRGAFPSMFPDQHRRLQGWSASQPSAVTPPRPDQPIAPAPAQPQPQAAPSAQPRPAQNIRLAPEQLPQVLKEAREAIQNGADPEIVRQRLIQNGVDPGGL